MKIVLSITEVEDRLKEALLREGMQVDSFDWSLTGEEQEMVATVTPCVPSTLPTLLETRVAEHLEKLDDATYRASQNEEAYREGVKIILGSIRGLVDDVNSGVHVTDQLKKSIDSLHKKVGSASKLVTRPEPKTEPASSADNASTKRLESMNMNLSDFERARELRKEKLAQMQEQIREEAEEFRNAKDPKRIMLPTVS